MLKIELTDREVEILNIALEDLCVGDCRDYGIEPEEIEALDVKLVIPVAHPPDAPCGSRTESCERCPGDLECEDYEAKFEDPPPVVKLLSDAEIRACRPPR